MRIVVSGYIGKKITGIGRNIISLLNAANDTNEYVVYTNYDLKDEMCFTNCNVDVKTYNVSKSDSLKNLLWTTFIFPFKVISENADLAIIPNFTLLIIKLRPTVIFMHDLIEFNVPNKFSKLKMFYRKCLADPISARKADKIITVSQNSKHDIEKFLKINSSKILVIYNGVDRLKFSPVPVERADEILRGKQIPSEFLLYAGTIDNPGKNVLGIIKAFEILKERGIYNGGLVLTGMPGSGYEVVEEYAKNSAWGKEITFTGFISDEELVALFSRCTVFCFVSLYEGFGIPPLEAMSCGAKVVVSNTSSLPEVAGDVGIQADPYSIEDIAKSIEQAINMPKGADYLGKVERHLNRFNWKEQYQILGAALKNLINRERR